MARFCIIAGGSATELEYQLLLARDLKSDETPRTAVYWEVPIAGPLPEDLGFIP